MNARLRLAGAILVTGLVACSTPPSALDAANNTAGLVGELDRELREFRRVQESFERHRKDLVRELAQAVGDSEAVIAESELFGGGTTSISTRDAAKGMLAMTTGLADIDRKTQADLAIVDKRLAELTAPLPATTDKAIEVQKALAVMGTELSSRVRAAEFETFYKAVREGVEKNRQKIRDVELQSVAN